MKKIILSTFLLTALGINFTSCKKEQELKNEIIENEIVESDTSLILYSLGDNKNGNNQLVFEPEFGVTEAMGMLIFRSSEDYWNTVQTEDPEKLERFINLVDNMDYTSFEESIIDDQTQKDTLYTGLMPKMINDKETIIIGRNIYKINMHEEKVYTMPAAAINEINELHIQNALNKKIKAYSTKADVIDVVEKKSGCGENCAQPSVKFKIPGRTGYGDKEIEFDMWIKYFHYGLGTDFDCHVDIRDQFVYLFNGTTWGWEETPGTNLYLFGKMERRYKIKCGSESGWYLLPPVYDYDNHLEVQSYNLRKCLTKFHGKATFQYKFNQSDLYHNFITTIGEVWPLEIMRGY